jgi:hypothetical protein
VAVVCVDQTTGVYKGQSLSPLLVIVITMLIVITTMLIIERQTGFITKSAEEISHIIGSIMNLKKP